jgi:hypothetical protein
VERVNRLELLPEAWKAAVLPLHHTRLLHVLLGRGGGIRTPDPLVPNQMRYQTALRPVPKNSLRSVSREVGFCKRRLDLTRFYHDLSSKRPNSALKARNPSRLFASGYTVVGA